MKESNISPQQILKVYLPVRMFTWLPNVLVALIEIFFYVSLIFFISIASHTRILFFLIPIVILPSAFFYFIYVYTVEIKTKVLLLNNKVVIKRPLFRDKTILISELLYINKNAMGYPWWLPRADALMWYCYIEFGLKNKSIIYTLMVQDCHDLIENIKKINPNIEIGDRFMR